MKKILLLVSFLFFVFIIGCNSDENPVDDNSNSDIPADPTNVSVPTPAINNIQPTSNFAKVAGNPNRVMMNVTGIINPVTNQAIQFVAQQNLFVTEDNVVKGLKVSPVGNNTILQADVVFTVDNSGSMGQESDSVAAGIIKFANFLQASGLDVKFGIVGYSGRVRGAINFTDATSIEAYLKRSFVSGTSRTIGFSGPDSADLEIKAGNFAPGVFQENGVVGVLFADTNFTWRSSAQSVFINFTDEPTQSNGVNWNTAQMCAAIGGRATVHTVFSNDSTAYNWDFDDERPWAMSLCTGGTFKFIDGNASGLDLTDLPVAGALANSFLVEFLSSNGNSSHNVEITVKEADADGKRVYTNITY